MTPYSDDVRFYGVFVGVYPVVDSMERWPISYRVC